MAVKVKRPKLSFFERIYFIGFFRGLKITLNHAINMLKGKTDVVLQYPEEKWDKNLPEYYRGVPALVKDEHGRERCVSCQLCEFICPPQAIFIKPGAIDKGEDWERVEKAPQEFDIDMTRCIFCGLCEEVCPEQAIFLTKNYSVNGFSRDNMVNNKEKLYEIGGVRKNLVHKWNALK